MADSISLGQWNRTLLHRQHLLTRVDEDPIEVLDRCVGFQSQEPRAAFAAFAARIEGCVAAEIDELISEREVIRMALLRSTIFLIDAQDARWIRPLAQAALDLEIERYQMPRLTGASGATGGVTGASGASGATAIVEAAREILDGAQLSGAALGARLAERFPGEPPSTLTAIARCGLPLVQVPPRGLFRGRGAPTYQLLDDWVGPGEPAVTGEDAVRDLIRLYLRGHGPATLAGITTWAGITGLGPIVSAMEADWELRELTGPDGETLYDIDGLEIVDESQPAPVRLIAPFDHVIMASADRRRVADEDRVRATRTANGRSPGFVLVDGRLAGTWESRGDRDAPSIAVDLFDDITAAQRDDLNAEIARLETFCATGVAEG